MKLSYRDDLGIVVIEIDTNHGIMFCGDHAYFTDTAGRDYKIPVSSLILIG